MQELITPKTNKELFYNLNDLPNEAWKEIPGYEGLYLCSNKGRIKSLKRNCGVKNINTKIIFQSYASNYPVVRLCRNNQQKYFQVHRLVCLLFNENPNKYLIVNHKNNIHDDNRTENLEWCTSKENSRHAWDNGFMEGARAVRIGSKNSASKLTEQQVKEMRSLYPNIISTYSRLGKQFGVSEVMARKIIVREFWKHVI